MTNIDKLIEQAEIHLEVRQDDTPIRGNAMASGDDDLDRKVEDEIIERLEDGDVWAWSLVEVFATVELNGETITGDSDYLGACCYHNQESFEACPYYDDMRAIAFGSLRRKLENIKLALD